MMRRARRDRGAAIIMVMLACVLLAAALAVMVDVGTAQLRRTVESARALEAQAGADAGAGWYRALLQANGGDLAATAQALGQTGGVDTITLDSHTVVQVTVVPIGSGGLGAQDHNDLNLQYNPVVKEQMIQLASTAVVVEDGIQVAQRTSTTLLRTFLSARPYSEIVGVVDDAGPDAIDSPGDAAGQAAAPNTTDLLVRAFTRTGDGPPVENDQFQALQWADGNPGGGGVLP
jgi:hypothetical protein